MSLESLFGSFGNITSICSQVLWNSKRNIGQLKERSCVLLNTKQALHECGLTLLIERPPIVSQPVKSCGPSSSKCCHSHTYSSAATQKDTSQMEHLTSTLPSRKIYSRSQNINKGRFPRASHLGSLRRQSTTLSVVVHKLSLNCCFTMVIRLCPHLQLKVTSTNIQISLSVM